MKLKFVIASAVLLSLISCNQSSHDSNQTTETENQEATAQATDSQKETKGVYFVNLHDGDKVTSPLFVEMGINGMEVEAAGAINAGKGHHHIIVDGTFEPEGTMVAKDETHIHYGKGQTSDTLKLTPGMHTLTLQFANGAHQSYGQDWSKTISITVSE